MGDAEEQLRELPSNSVHCTVTSPPYWGALRDYEHPRQVGHEASPEEYVKRLVDAFRPLQRVLRPDGVFWLNLGDCYLDDGQRAGVPWLVVTALRSSGWFWRQEIVWHKPNPMPFPATKRCVDAHEYVFLLTRSADHFFDYLSIREPFADDRQGRDGSSKTRQRNRGGRTDGYTKPNGIDPSGNGGRNRRSVWSVSASSKRKEHVAKFPPALVDPLIRAGSSGMGACSSCGASWERTKKGWIPTCDHDSSLRPCVILDPFAGSGTTGEVALALKREFIGIELNPDYAREMIVPRLTGVR